MAPLGGTEPFITGMAILNCRKFTKEVPSGSYLSFRNARDAASVITLAQCSTVACELSSVDKALPGSDLLRAGYPKAALIPMLFGGQQ
jgi:hypothetical protein